MEQNNIKHNYTNLLKLFALSLDKISEGIRGYEKTDAILYDRYKDYLFEAVDYCKVKNNVIKEPIDNLDFYEDIVKGESYYISNVHTPDKNNADNYYDFNFDKLPNEIKQLILFLREANKQLDVYYDINDKKEEFFEIINTDGLLCAIDYVTTWLYQNNHLDVDNDEIYIHKFKETKKGE